MSNANEVSEALATITEAAKPWVPEPYRTGLYIGSVALQSAGSIWATDLEVADIAAQGAAAGQAAHNASKLAGLREAIERIVLDGLLDGAICVRPEDHVDAIMAEVLKRWPQ